MSEAQPPVVCDLTVFTEEQKSTQLGRARILLDATREERDDGFDFHFTEREDLVRDLGAYIELERRCCAFFTFALTVHPANRGATLTITAPEQGRELLLAGIELLSKDLPVDETIEAWAEHPNART